MFMKYFVVLEIKKYNIYLWDYSNREVYDLNLYSRDNTNLIEKFDLIGLDENQLSIDEINGIIKIEKDSLIDIAGKVSFPKLISKLNMLYGNPCYSFDEVLLRSVKNRRFMCLVKFSGGSYIKNNQVKISSLYDYSYIDILDNGIKNYENRIFKGYALIEFLPNKNINRRFNLISALNFKVVNEKKVKEQKSPGLDVDIEFEELAEILDYDDIEDELLDSPDDYYNSTDYEYDLYEYKKSRIAECSEYFEEILEEEYPHYHRDENYSFLDREYIEEEKWGNDDESLYGTNDELRKFEEYYQWIDLYEVEDFEIPEFNSIEELEKYEQKQRERRRGISKLDVQEIYVKIKNEQKRLYQKTERVFNDTFHKLEIYKCFDIKSKEFPISYEVEYFDLINSKTNISHDDTLMNYLKSVDLDIRKRYQNLYINNFKTAMKDESIKININYKYLNAVILRISFDTEAFKLGVHEKILTKLPELFDIGHVTYAFPRIDMDFEKIDDYQNRTIEELDNNEEGF